MSDLSQPSIPRGFFRQLRRRGERPPSVAAPTKPSPLESARRELNRKVSAQTLITYLSLEPDKELCQSAAVTFLSRAAENHAPFMPSVVSPDAEFGMAQRAIREHLRDDDYDNGFLQNIARFGDVLKRARDQVPQQQVLLRCIQRMEAANHFCHDQLSDAAVEVGIAFLLASAPARVDDLTVFWEMLDTAALLSTRRAVPGLTRQELEKVRDRIIWHPTIALAVQKRMPPA